MKAVFCTKYGSPEVLQIHDVEKPIPKDNEVLIKIHASTVTMGDCELRNLTLPLWTRIPIRLYMGYRKPKRFIPGMEFSGVIEMVGKDVVKFKEGDSVFGSSGFRMASNAEYKCQPLTYTTAIKPSNVSHQEAATIPVGGLNALHFLRKANIKPGQKVLINGAGGSIGSYGVLLAKYYGAEVTAVDSTEKLDMLIAIGADQVIDYTMEDFTKRSEKYDIIFNVVYGTSFSGCIQALKPQGCYLMANPSPSKMLRGHWVSKRTNKKVVFEFAGERADDLVYLAELIDTGKIKPVIDRTFSLKKIAEAHDYVEKGHKKGSVVITTEYEHHSYNEKNIEENK